MSYSIAKTYSELFQVIFLLTQSEHGYDKKAVRVLPLPFSSVCSSSPGVFSRILLLGGS